MLFHLYPATYFLNPFISFTQCIHLFCLSSHRGETTKKHIKLVVSKTTYSWRNVCYTCLTYIVHIHFRAVGYIALYGTPYKSTVSPTIRIVGDKSRTTPRDAISKYLCDRKTRDTDVSTRQLRRRIGLTFVKKCSKGDTTLGELMNIDVCTYTY